MDQNVGTLDRLSRAVIALALIFTLIRSGKASMLSALMLAMGGALLSTAMSGTCALYTHLGLSTSEKL
jgi:hypothetical protein